MDLSPILCKIQSSIEDRGRAATDPKILLAVWVYAIVQGIGSARMIDRYCEEHIAFKWLCGGVKIKGKRGRAPFTKNPYEEKIGEHEELAEWRVRMGLNESKEIYKDRAATSEWVNAGMRNRGLRQLMVRGCEKVGAVLGLHVLTHNILRALKFGFSKRGRPLSHS